MVASGLSARFRRKDTLQTLLNAGTASVPTFLSFTTGFPHSAVQAARKASPFAPRAFSRVLAGTTGSATLDLVPLGSNPTREILPTQPHYPARYPCAAAARRPLDSGTTPPGLASCELWLGLGSNPGPIPSPPERSDDPSPLTTHQTLLLGHVWASIPTKHLSPTSGAPRPVAKGTDYSASCLHPVENTPGHVCLNWDLIIAL